MQMSMSATGLNSANNPVTMLLYYMHPYLVVLVSINLTKQ